ncbi:MAG: TrmB family transcriptional regulator [Dorea sp.]
METNPFVEKLMEFDLTRQEAAIYPCMLRDGKVTGYEVAKSLGISRSNAYNSLASMTEKGASYIAEEGTTKKYIPVPLDEFCKNHIRKLEDGKKWLLTQMPAEKHSVEGFITIEGARHVLNKMKNLLAKVEERAYISCTRNYLLLLVEELEKLKEENKKIVIITDHPVTFGNAKVYVGEPKGMQIGLITDSKYVLTGEYGEGSMNTCLYSGQKYFVELYKRALSNEIQLLSIREEKERS